MNVTKIVSCHQKWWFRSNAVLWLKDVFLESQIHRSHRPKQKPTPRYSSIQATNHLNWYFIHYYSCEYCCILVHTHAFSPVWSCGWRQAPTLDVVSAGVAHVVMCGSHWRQDPRNVSLKSGKKINPYIRYTLRLTFVSWHATLEYMGGVWRIGPYGISFHTTDITTEGIILFLPFWAL